MKAITCNRITWTMCLIGIVGILCGPLPAQDFSALVQTASFTATRNSDYPISVAQAKSSLNAFLCFDRGSRVLSNYKEPQITRGAKGISIFRQVSPAVTLVVTGNDENIDAIGTGVVVDSSGYVLTNWHVVSGHQDAVIFMKPPVGTEVDKKYAYYARVVYANPLPDLALLKLLGAPSGLPAVAVADITQAEVAEDIHIIGHPHGQLWSYSTGVLSQIRPDYSWKYEDGSQHRAKVLQMQTAINPGNSGGPVVDDSGKLIGLVAMYEEGQSLDYAIAADVIKAFIAQGRSSAQTRGAARQPEVGEPSTVFEAPAENGRLYKSEYAGSVMYWMSDKNGFTSHLLITDSQGNRIEATRAKDASIFSEWRATLQNGDVIRASTTSGIPEVLWRETTPQSK